MYLAINHPRSDNRNLGNLHFGYLNIFLKENPLIWILATSFFFKTDFFAMSYFPQPLAKIGLRIMMLAAKTELDFTIRAIIYKLNDHLASLSNISVLQHAPCMCFQDAARQNCFD